MYRDELTDAFLEQAFTKAVSVRLERLPAESPHVFSRRFRRRMEAVLRQSARPPQVNRVIFLGRRTVAVLVAAIVLAFGAVMSVSNWHNAVRPFNDSFDDGSVHLFYRPEKVFAPPGELEKYNLREYPEGYELIFSTQTKKSFMQYFQDAAGEGLYFIQAARELDLDAVLAETIAARKLPKRGEHDLRWNNSEYMFLLAASSPAMDLEPYRDAVLPEVFSTPNNAPGLWDGIYLPETLIKYLPTAIPADFKIMDSYVSEMTQDFYYENAAGECIFYTQTRLDKMNIGFYGGEINWKPVELSDGTIAQYDTGEDCGIILWENSMYAFLIQTQCSSNLDVIELAESTVMVDGGS